MIAVVTVHGIGSQEAPSGLAGSDGYADGLHEGLRTHLGVALGDDPNRGRLRAHNYRDNDVFCSAAAEPLTASPSRA